MKKLFLFTLMFGLLVGLSCGQSITVTSPGAGNYSQTDTLRIVWTVSEITGNVKIVLRKSDGSGGTILQESYSATGSPYSHSLAGVAPGEYFIKIKQGTVFGKSPVFTVTAPSQSIMVNSPRGGGSYTRGDDRLLIQWLTTGITGNVKVNIRKEDGSGGITIDESIAYNRRQLTWAIPSNVEPGNYFVKVKQGSISGVSRVFEIKNKFTTLIVPGLVRLSVYDLYFTESIRDSLVFKRLYFKGGKDYRVEFDMKIINTALKVDLKNIKIDWYIQEVGGSTISLRGLNVRSPFTIGRLNAGETYTKHFNLVFGKQGRRNADYPRIKKGKRYRIVIQIDKDNKFVETNERNNTTNLTFGPVPR